MVQFNYHLLDESDQDAINTATHIGVLIFFLISKVSISSLFTTMWDHTDGCTKQYHYESYIYLRSFLDLQFCIIIDRVFGAPGHGKCVVGGLNAIYKCMFKLVMSYLLNPELSCDDT